MIRNRCSAVVKGKDEIDEAFARRFARSTTSSRGKILERKPEEKKWYESEEIASQYLYCVKDPPCQTCRRYNNKLFKSLLEQRRECPPSYQNKISERAHPRHRVSPGRPTEGTTMNIKNDTHCCHHVPGQCSDMTASRKVGVPSVGHSFHSDVKDLSLSRFHAESCDSKKSSDAASRRGIGTSYCSSVEATAVPVNSTRNISPPPPLAAAGQDDEDKGKAFSGRQKTCSDLKNLTALPSIIPEGISRYDSVPTNPDPACGDHNVHWQRDASGKVFRHIAIHLASPLSGRPLVIPQPSSPTKVPPRSAGDAIRSLAEEREFFCRSSTQNVANGCEGKVQTGTLVDRPQTMNTSLSTRPFNSCSTDQLSALQSLLKIPAISSLRGDSCSLLQRDSSVKITEPPAHMGNSSTAKPPRPPSLSRTISPCPPLSTPGRPRVREAIDRRPICKHSPSKPCNISCFDQYNPTNRTHNFDTGYSNSRPCTLPDIFARRNNINLSSPNHQDDRRIPFWKTASKPSSPWRADCSRTSYGRFNNDTAYNRARWKAAMERDFGLSKSQRRMNGKAMWKGLMIEREVIAGR